MIGLWTRRGSRKLIHYYAESDGTYRSPCDKASNMNAFENPR